MILYTPSMLIVSRTFSLRALGSTFLLRCEYRLGLTVTISPSVWTVELWKKQLRYSMRLIRYNADIQWAVKASNVLNHLKYQQELKVVYNMQYLKLRLRYVSCDRSVSVGLLNLGVVVSYCYPFFLIWICGTAWGKRSITKRSITKRSITKRIKW